MPEATAPVAPAAPAAPVAPPAPAEAKTPAAGAAPAPAAPVEEKPKPISPQLAAIAKKERELHAAQEKLKAERAEIDAIRKQAADLEGVKKQAKLNPIAFMQAHGLTFAEVQDFILRDQQPAPEVKASEELKSVREQVEALAKAREDEKTALQQAAVERAQKDWASKLGETLKAGAEKYEFVAAHGAEAIELMKDAFEAAYDKDKTVLTHEQLLERAEAYYEAKTAGLLQTKKARVKLGIDVSKPAGQQAASESSGPRRAVPRTLTNSTAAPAAIPATGRPLTREERIEAATEGIRALNRAKRG